MLVAKLFISAALALSCSVALSQTASRGDAFRGRTIYATYGCAPCHGYQGQGSNAGPRVAPDPAPYAAFAYQLRRPRTRMPAYSLKLMSDQDVADMYAYLLTIPKASQVAEIALLSGSQWRVQAGDLQ